MEDQISEMRKIQALESIANSLSSFSEDTKAVRENSEKSKEMIEQFENTLRDFKENPFVISNRED